jgi:predicted ferric reductase
MKTSRRIGVILTTSCAFWSLSFLLFGATPAGKVWYANVASKFFDTDVKGGVPVMVLAFPVLLAGTTSVLFNVRSEPCGLAKPTFQRQRHLPPIWIRRLLQRWSADSDKLLVFIPLLIFLFANIHRHLYDSELGLDEKFKEVSNSFAFVALIAMSYFLIPVARQSPLLKFVNWSPAAAVRLHIWSGRTIIVAVLVHSLMHMIRWSNFSRENLVSMIFPPAPCWTLQDTKTFEPTCNDTETECSCYHLFRNLTGFVGLLGLLVIAATTVRHVRRNHYRVFYMTHVLAAPTVLIMVILHWRRSVLYMAPSLLYYVASSAPLLTESALKNKNSSVRIVAVTYLASRADRHCQRPCVSLTLAVSNDASLNFAPGQYVKLLAPKVSSISHPFTINRVIGKRNEMRIIFRATGPFTRQLAHSLTNDSTNLPVIHMDGFHGISQRVDQLLKHDCSVLVAGGIGITPYLSLLHEFVSVMIALRQQPSMQGTLTKEVILHWMCRDQALLEYVTDQYFDPLWRWNASKAAGCRIRIVVYRTNQKTAETSLSDSAEMTHESTIATTPDNNGGLAPFTPSRFSSGKTTSMFGNFFPFVTFATTAWIGLWATWRLYMSVTFDDEIIGRGWTALAIIAIAVVVAILANFSARILDRGRARPLTFGLLENATKEHEYGAMEEGSAMQPLVAGENRSDNVESDNNLTAVTYEETVGRPTVHQLLKSLEGATCPGLFVCGPKPLMQELRDAADEQYQIRIRHCRSGTPQIAIYEEIFEL